MDEGMIGRAKYISRIDHRRYCLIWEMQFDMQYNNLSQFNRQIVLSVV